MHYSNSMTLFQAFYNILPKEGLDPPARPNFQPIYDEHDLVRSRHSDKSVGHQNVLMDSDIFHPCCNEQQE